MARDLRLLPAEYEALVQPGTALVGSPARLGGGRVGPLGSPPEPAGFRGGPAPTDARSVLLDALSHELRTALALVSGYSQTVLHLDLEETDRGRYLARISAASEQVAELSEEMLAIAASPDAAAPRYEPVAIGNLVSRVARRLVEESQMPQPAMGLPLDLPLVRADPIWIGRVLRALLLDAASSEAAGEISLEAAATPEAVVVTVATERTDCRDGLPPSPSTLRLCQELVEAHGGRVWREPPGEMEAISFSLPRYRRPAPAVVPGPAPSAVRPSLRAGLPVEP